MTSPTTIWLVRHGHVHNPRGIIYGRMPRFRLSERGLEEARAAGRAMAGIPIAAAYSSPLLRARQTAGEILAHHPGIPLRRTPLLLEVLTIFEGRDGLEGDRRGGDYYTGVGPPYEQPQDILDRVRKVLRGRAPAPRRPRDHGRHPRRRRHLQHHLGPGVSGHCREQGQLPQTRLRRLPRHGLLHRVHLPHRLARRNPRSALHARAA